MAEQILTHDLRAEGREFNRDKTSRVKWAHGPSFGPGRRAEDNRPRPARVAPAIKTTMYGMSRAARAVRYDIADGNSDSSADEDVEHPSVAPVPDAEITYSYDAQRGPSQGSQILGQALAKAVERFEVRQTDKLIKDEYDVLDMQKEALTPGPRISKGGHEEDDYEFVDA